MPIPKKCLPISVKTHGNVYEMYAHMRKLEWVDYAPPDKRYIYQNWFHYAKPFLEKSVIRVLHCM